MLWKGPEHPGETDWWGTKRRGLSVDALEKSPDRQDSATYLYTHLLSTPERIAMRLNVKAFWKLSSTVTRYYSPEHYCCVCRAKTSSLANDFWLHFWISPVSVTTPDDVAFSKFGDGNSSSQTVAHNVSGGPNHTLACALSHTTIVPVRESACEKLRPLLKWQLSKGDSQLPLPPPAQRVFAKGEENTLLFHQLT